MATIERFEDLKVWQKARQLNKEIYKVSNTGAFSKDFGLRDQIRRSSISIVSNIAEGYERNGTKEFNQFLSIAKASAAELRAQLYVSFDLEYISEQEFNTLISIVLEVSKMLSGLMSYLQTTEIKGNKFKESAELYGTNQL
ncbi:MAG: four helix bundle protein [Bacteroidetes bacterium]|nr:four helix bundle protein [Bacteroidota bacterium]